MLVILIRLTCISGIQWMICQMRSGLICDAACAACFSCYVATAAGASRASESLPGNKAIATLNPSANASLLISGSFRNLVTARQR